jgi:hypothetical protein
MKIKKLSPFQQHHVEAKLQQRLAGRRFVGTIAQLRRRVSGAPGLLLCEIGQPRRRQGAQTAPPADASITVHPHPGTDSSDGGDTQQHHDLPPRSDGYRESGKGCEGDNKMGETRERCGSDVR